MESGGKRGEDWSVRDQVGCLLVYFCLWLPTTLLLLGFAGTIDDFMLGMLEGAASGNLPAFLYVLFSVPALVLPVLLARTAWRDEERPKPPPSA